MLPGLGVDASPLLIPLIRPDFHTFIPSLVTPSALISLICIPNKRACALSSISQGCSLRRSEFPKLLQPFKNESFCRRRCFSAISQSAFSNTVRTDTAATRRHQKTQESKGRKNNNTKIRNTSGPNMCFFRKSLEPKQGKR